jgi:DNA-binding transcriptional LysR family regulator
MRDLNAMATFVAVVNYNSFSVAAEKCGISKALATKHIQELEASLGMKLLHRTTRKLGLTQAGERFYERCARIVSDAEDAIRDIGDMSQAEHGLIRVSTAISFGRLHLLPAIAEFLRAHPSVQVDVCLSENFGDLISGGADIIVRMADEPHLSNLVARKLAPVNFAVVATPEYCAGHAPILTPDDLARHNCVTYSGTANREWVLADDDGEHVVKPSGNYRANNGDGVVEAVLAGVGVGIVPTFVAGAYLKSGRLVRLLDGYRLPTRTLYAIFLPDARLPQRVRNFIRFLVDRFGPVPYWDA